MKKENKSLSMSYPYDSNKNLFIDSKFNEVCQRFKLEIENNNYNKYVMYLNIKNFSSINSSSSITEFLQNLIEPKSKNFKTKIFVQEYLNYNIIKYIFDENHKINLNEFNEYLIENKIDDVKVLYKFCKDLLFKKKFLKKINEQYCSDQVINKFLYIFFDKNLITKENFIQLNQIISSNKIYKLKWIEYYKDFSIFNKNNIKIEFTNVIHEFLLSNINYHIDFKIILNELYKYFEKYNLLEQKNNFHFLNLLTILLFKDVNDIIKYPSIKNILEKVKNKNETIYNDITQFEKDSTLIELKLLDKIRYEYFEEPKNKTFYFCNFDFKSIFFYYSFPIYKNLIKNHKKQFNKFTYSMIVDSVDQFIIFKFKLFFKNNDNELKLNVKEILYFLYSKEIHSNSKSFNNKCYKYYFDYFLKYDKIKNILGKCSICKKNDNEIKLINWIEEKSYHNFCYKEIFNNDRLIFLSDLFSNY